MSRVAFVNSDPSVQGVHNFNDVAVLRLGLSAPGLYLIIGRVVLGNDDDGIQPANARCTVRDGSVIVDKAEMRMPENCSQTIHLQGTARVNPGQSEIVDIRCSTYRGSAGQSSLFAIQVDELRFS